MTTGNKIVLAIVSLGVGFGQPHPRLVWKGPGGCVVDYADTPCRTVRYHTFDFGDPLEGPLKFEIIDAFDRDGSKSSTLMGRSGPSSPFPLRMIRITDLTLHREKRRVYIDHFRRVYEGHDNSPSNVEYWEEDDSECTHTASRYADLSARLPDSVVAGVHVVGYRGLGYLGAEHEVYFAPSIGCQEMRIDVATRGFLGWKTSGYQMVDSYELGPPDPSLFRVPAGYKQVASILSP